MSNGKENEAALGSDEEEEEEDEKRYQCGVGSWRPSWLQACANMRTFTATLSAIHIFGNMNYSYYTAIITQIERRYGLSSSMTGFIKNVDQIGYTCTILLVSHFLRYANKPVVFSVATAITSVAIFMFSLPHFVFSGDDDVYVDFNGTSPSSNSTLSKYEYCDGVDESEADGSSCNSRNVLLPFNAGALGLFILSELLQGIAQSPKHTLSVTYMDDNVKENSPKHIGVMLGMRAFSPILGFLLGAWATTIYVDLSDSGLDQHDPRWVGAWWLGFIICAACSMVWAVPLLLFPKEMKGAKHKQPKKSQPAVKKNMKDLPRAFLRMCKNQVLLCITLGGCCNMFLIGYSTFIPKYMQLQFGLTASMASILTGCVSIFSWCVGPILSGILVAHYKLNQHQLLRVILIANVLALFGFVSNMFIGCEGPEWAGEMSLDRQDASMGCNSNCSCDPGLFTPVCGSDGLTYFSSCFAGCTAHVDADNGTLFTNCQCIEGAQQTAVPGVCPAPCNMLIPYILIKIVSLFIISMSFVPLMTTMMRSVDEKDKALAMGFSGFFTQICSFPAPMLFGAVIDSACVVTQSACGRKGACLLYDAESFRYKLHGFAGGMKLLAVVFYLYAWYITRHVKYDDSSADDDKPRENGNASEKERLNGDLDNQRESKV